MWEMFGERGNDCDGPSMTTTGAMFALKKKKLYEDEIAKLHGARITLENQIMALEGAAVNVETFRAMESGAQAMRAVRGNM